ncbi:MAG: hypothetical protein IJV27_05985 [Prevotella sp.]|nr:hypothetical protein [Prevotella sp.]
MERCAIRKIPFVCRPFSASLVFKYAENGDRVCGEWKATMRRLRVNYAEDKTQPCGEWTPNIRRLASEHSEKGGQIRGEQGATHRRLTSILRTLEVRTTKNRAKIIRLSRDKYSFFAFQSLFRSPPFSISPRSEVLISDQLS